MAENGSGRPAPPQLPGQYGSVRPPDRHAEEQRAKARVREMGKAAGVGNGGAIDGLVDGDVVNWTDAIETEYAVRKQALETELAAADAEKKKRERELKEVQLSYQTVKDAYVRAFFTHTGYLPPDDPGAAPSTEMAVHKPDTLPDRVPDERFRYPFHGDLNGPTLFERLHYVLLVLAFAADLVAFYQVLALVLGTYPIILYTLVGTASLLALALMHQCGKCLRDRRALQGDGRLWILLLCGGAWTVLGVGAFYLRLSTADTNGLSNSLTEFGGTVSGNSDSALLIKALLFLAIYLVTGVVALLGAYFTWNPLRKKYFKAHKAQEAAKVGFRAANEHVELAEQQVVVVTKRIDDEPAARQRAVDHRHKLGCYLKVVARHEIAVILQDEQAARFLLRQEIPGCRPALTDDTAGDAVIVDGGLADDRV